MSSLAAPRYTGADILRQLDECARAMKFLMLDNGYVYPAAVGLHAYRDATRWALVIEDLGFMYRAGGHSGISNALYCYGNCLSRAPGADNQDFLHLTEDGPEGPTFDDEYEMYVRDSARSLRVRGVVLPINRDPVFLVSKGIKLAEPPRLMAFELLRSLLPEHRALFHATEQELRQRVPADLPCILRLEEWNHPDLCNNELPSQSETFQMIAEVLATGDPARYQPTKKPNTHWSNWPEGGTL